MDSGSDAGRIKLKIDLTTGGLELDAPATQFESALQQVQVLAEALDLGRGSGTRFDTGTQRAADESSPVALLEAPASPVKQGPRPKLKTGKSSSRAGRIGSFEVVKSLLSEEQEISLRGFMSEKSPTEQPDQVLVAIVKGEQILNRRGFSFNEIYTLMWLSGIKELPKALDVVLQKLTADQMVIRDEAGYSAKFIGRNRVEGDLPVQDRAK